LSIRIRHARAEDYPAATAIHNAQNEPDLHVTPQRLLLSDERSSERDPAFRRYVACPATSSNRACPDTTRNDDIIAMGYIRANWSGTVQPGRYWLGLFVRHDHRGKGIDLAMLRHAELELIASGREPCEFASCIRQDFVEAAGYLAPERFEETFRSWGAHLDLGSFDACRFEPSIERLRRSGVRLASYRDLAADPERDRRLVALQRELERDVLAFEPIIPRRAPDVTDPETVLDTCFVAIDPEGSYIGIASAFGKPGALGVGSAFTGVARPYRGRGIATALKSRTAEAARALGCLDMNAGGGGVDTAMMRVNRKLGFEIEPAWLTFVSERSRSE
jgi:GNAT superfamily N-acetyltransferase